MQSLKHFMLVSETVFGIFSSLIDISAEKFKEKKKAT